MTYTQFYLSLALITIIWLGILAYKETVKNNRELEKKQKETEKYLTTCLNRATLSTSPEALELLWGEMYENLGKYLYSRTSYARFREIRALIRGKYLGLHKSSVVLEERRIIS